MEPQGRGRRISASHAETKQGPRPKEDNSQIEGARDMRVRTGRVRKVEPLRAGGSSRLSPQGLRRSIGFRFS